MCNILISIINTYIIQIQLISFFLFPFPFRPKFQPQFWIIQNPECHFGHIWSRKLFPEKKSTIALWQNILLKSTPFSSSSTSSLPPKITKQTPHCYIRKIQKFANGGTTHCTECEFDLYAGWFCWCCWKLKWNSCALLRCFHHSSKPTWPLTRSLGHRGGLFKSVI